jgi:hypothetical protein
VLQRRNLDPNSGLQRSVCALPRVSARTAYSRRGRICLGEVVARRPA